MDTTYMTQLLLSLSIFAPGLILLAALSLVGLVMIVERTVLRGQLVSQPARALDSGAAPTANPAAGPVVSGLKAALAAQQAESQQPPRRAVG